MQLIEIKQRNLLDDFAYECTINKMIKKNRCERRQIMVDSLVNVDDELIESI